MTLTQHGECVLEPTFLYDQSGDPGLCLDAASQRLQPQPPELCDLVPALLPVTAHPDGAGAGAGVQGATQEPEGGGEKPPLACLHRAWKCLKEMTKFEVCNM